MAIKLLDKKTAYIIIGLFFLLNLPTVGYGETDFGILLGTDDKGELNRVIDETEKVLEKNPKDIDSITKRGIAYHNIAHSKVKGVAKTCVKYLKKDTKAYPDDALLLALLGSCTTMIGRDAKAIDKKMRSVNKGTGLIDRAIMMAPDHVLARMVRANNSSGIPKLFKRRKFTKIDLLHIDKVLKKSPEAINKATQAQVYYKLGKIFYSEGDKAMSQSYYKKAVAVSPDSIWAKRASKRI